MKNFMVPSAIIAAAKICAATTDVRYYLCGVYIDNERIVGTNGHVMFICNWKQWNEDNNEHKLQEPVILSISVAIPAKGASGIARLSMANEKTGIIEYTDRAGSPRISATGSFSLIDGKYPDLAPVIEKVSGETKPITGIGFSQKYLNLCGKVFKLVNPKYNMARMSFFGEEKPALASTSHHDYGKCDMIIMPCRT